MVRLGLAASLNGEPGLEVVGEADSVKASLAAYRKHRPDLVIMDLRLPDGSGSDATVALCREFPDATVLILSTHSGEEDVYRALHSGAKGYVLKSAAREQLLYAIREITEGRRYIDPAVAPLLAERLSRPSITAREMEVLRMLVKGLSNKEIAAQLNVAEVTIKLHVSHLLEKMHVSDRTQAATMAIQKGMVQFD